MHRTGSPAPAIRLIDPGSIVVGRPAPGFIGDPGPAERVHPGPMTVMIRTPVGPSYMRPPDPAVPPIVAPVTIYVRIVCDNGDIVGKIFAMLAVQVPIFAGVASGAPVIEGVMRR